ncbi:MAG: VWA domain-containing protein [Bryobacterales bacterium]|nr:VWA domain-containing protein [Bryobacteraceae bacterium]MDW8354458.1 VWA domain-containing protein [Bryobacterales bacterium]
MSLLNLSLGELLALLGAVSGLLVALYLLDRSRQRVLASTLRFWRPAAAPTENRRRRRRIRQPWSLALQLASTALLLLAIAQLRIGASLPAGRDHVLILDTSAWMAARTRDGRLAEQAKERALAWLRRLPASDRVLVVRADAAPTPVTGFETDRELLEEALRAWEPGWTALDLAQAVAAAERLLELYSAHPGEIVFVGPGRTATEPEATALPARFRFLPLASPPANCGLKQVLVQRSAQDATLWEILVAVANDGAQRAAVPLSVTFAGRPVGLRRLSLGPGERQEVVFELHTRAGGWLEARLDTGDALALDDRALLELPEYSPLRIVICSDRPEWLRPILAANPNLEAEFRSSAQCQAGTGEQLAILDGVAPAVPPRIPALWIRPPAPAAPVAIRQTVRGAVLNWRRDQPLSAGLRSRDLYLETAQILETALDDLVLAEVEAGPVLAARPRQPRLVVIGFDPAERRLRYELATPLLFANLLNWLAPGSFQQVSLAVASPGMVTVPLEPFVEAASIAVRTAEGLALPFTVRDSELRFFAGAPGLVRIEAPGRQILVSLTLPEAGGRLWQVPPTVLRGMPSRFSEPRFAELWPLLAMAGGAGLLLEWAWFGRRRVRHLGAIQAASLRQLLRKAS